MGKKNSGTRRGVPTGVNGGVHDLGSKAQRNVELLSAPGSFFASEMDDGDRIGMTRLAKSLPRADDGFPHVNTVPGEVHGALCRSGFHPRNQISFQKRAARCG
jgi:hypothetical protein